MAYHYLVDRNGHVLVGRDVAFPGDTFTNYDPAGHFLVVAEGNFDVEEPTSAQIMAIADILAEPDRAARMGAAARARVLRTFQWSDAADRLVSVFEDVLRAAHGRPRAA